MPFINKNPLNYPANSSDSIRIFQDDRAPTTTDFKSFIIGDEWWDTSSFDFWKLVFKDGTQGTWRKMAGTAAAVETFIPDSGTSPVVPTGTNQVTFTGGTGIETVGSLNTMTWNIDADIAQLYTEDVGTATPAANNLNIVGGTSIDTAGAGATVTINASATLANLYTADVGTATPAANNLNILGGTGLNTAGAGSTITINADTGFAPITKYVVDPDGTADYTTIQAALDAANALVPDAVIYARPAIYTENLTLYDGMIIEGATLETVISGNHIPPNSGTFTFKNLFLSAPAGDVLASAAAGTAILLCDNCFISVINGYIYDLPNWTGSLAIVNCTDSSTNNGVINNSAVGNVLISSSFAGRGVGNVLTHTSGTFDIIGSRIGCPLAIGGTSTTVINEGSSISGTITTSGTATVSITNTKISTGATQAISHGSANDITLAEVNIDSSNNPSIGGAGAGNLQIGSVTFLDDNNIAGTVNLDYTTALETGVGYLNNISFDRGTSQVDTDGELIIGDTGGVPIISTLTAGTGIGIVNGAGSITINASATTLLQVTAEDSSTAAPAANNLNIVGTATNGINTTAAGSTLTIAMATPYEDGDFEFRNAAVTTPRTLLINNTDTGVGSLSEVHIQTPDTGDDPFLNWEIVATQEYSFGIDNSDSDNLKLTDGASPSAGNVFFQMTTAGVPSFPTAPLDVPSGGTGVNSITDHALIVGSGVAAVTEIGPLTNGQLPIGSTGADPVAATLTAGTNISITNGAGSITINATAAALSWVEVTAATQAMAITTSYGANRGGGITFTLPATAAAGSVMEIVGMAGLWVLAQNAGQTVHVGAFSTTTGAGGSLTATNAGDCIILRCITADTDFRVQNMVGNITIA